MFGELWHSYLYQPVFNGLIWIYNNWTNYSFGWAIVYLTIIVRLIVLPFTIITEKNRVDNSELEDELVRVEKELHNDPVLKKQEVRRILKKRKVSPWSKVISLGVQGLVLILLYQVFIQGITGERVIRILYPFIEFPGKINTVFYGFHLEERHTWFFPIIVSIGLMLEIYVGLKDKKMGVARSDMFYFLLFPIATVFILWWLPLVKSIFILTSIIISAIIHWFSTMVFSKKTSIEHTQHAHH